MMTVQFPLPDDYGIEILRSEVGSNLLGTALPGHGDRDEMGIFIEWPESVIGFKKRDHWEFRTAGGNNPSGSDDTDLTVYSLRHWTGLALNGNPSVIALLFAPTDKLLLLSDEGEALRMRHHWFASKRAGKSFLGYMEQQRQRMVGERGKAGRVRLMPDGGVDWKYAMHMVRLGWQGMEYLQTGKLTLPIPGDMGDYFRQIRSGQVMFEDVIRTAESYEAEVKLLLDGKSPLPDQPDTEAIQRWLIGIHQLTWRREGRIS